MNINMMISNNNSKRVCPECDKEFESGKALGGHMRIHAQAVKKQQRLFANYLRSDSENSSMSAQVFPCSHCTKTFPSTRSLFGHLRCHPERDWKGTRPPPWNYSSSSLSEDDDDDDDDDDDEEDFGDDGDMVVDCSQLMPKWPVKGPVKARRGRKAIKRGLSIGIDDEDDEEDDEEEMSLRDGASALLLLNHVIDGSEFSGSSTLGAAVEQITGSNQHHEEVNNVNSWTGNNREEELDDLRLVGNGSDEQVGKVDNYPVPAVLRKMGIEEGGSSDPVINDKDTQGKKMVTGNSKNKKAKKMKMVMELNQPEKASGIVGTIVQAAVAPVATGKYKCSSCDKTFSSHQALGGHRASHNKFMVKVINGTDSLIKKSVSAFAPPDQSQHQQQQLNTSNDQVNSVLMSEECSIKRTSIDEVGGSSTADHISTTAQYECSVCNKIFPSGPALGGHKRCHWAAPAADAQTAEAQAQLAVRSSSGEEASAQAGGKRIRLMGFDLYVPASMVDDAA